MCAVDLTFALQSTDFLVASQIFTHLEFRFLVNASGWLPPNLRYAVQPENVIYLMLVEALAFLLSFP